MANNTLLASDSFTSGSLASGWTAAFSYSVCKVVAGSPNVTEPNAVSTTAGQIWTGLVWPNCQTSEVTIQALTVESASFIVPCVRYQSGSDSGYRLNLTNDTAGLYRFDNGTPTQIGSTVSGLTIAAGDVWALHAAGACLSVYQNGKRILFNFDTTYTSGSPGFFQFSSTNITHTQVASWRGYSAVQQDGIWQKQGIVIPAIASDTLASGIGAWINSNILYEGNAQVLSGNVYKMWFNAGDNIGYAESLDGLNWTRYASAVISGQSVPMVFKVGSTYYMYTQPSPGASSDFVSFTSTDGINWASQGTTGLGKGTAGQWDSAFVYSLQPVAIIGGVWYGLYTGGNNAVSYTGSLGLATSADGITWTKYASNPLVANFWNAQAIVNVAGVWYMWGEINSPGRGNSGNAGLDPTETIRIQSLDLITWTNPVKSLHNSQMHESLNATSGQCFPNAIIDIGGKAHLYHTSDPSDDLSPHVYQIGLSIGPAPIASIITQNEDAMPQVAADPFTSGTGDLSSNWTVPSGATKAQIVSGNFVEPTVLSTSCIEVYTGSIFSNSQYSEVTINTLASGCFINLLTRASVAAQTWYQANLAGPTGSLQATAISIYKTIAGSSTRIQAATMSYTPQVGDIFQFAATVGNSGNTILSLYQNGFLILQVEDFSNAIASGSPGFVVYAITSLANSQISGWAGGNANVLPPYPSTAVGWSPVDSRQAVSGFGPGANTGIVDAQGNVIYSAQDPPFTGNSQVSDNSAIPVVDSRVNKPADSRVNTPINSRTAPPFDG